MFLQFDTSISARPETITGSEIDLFQSTGYERHITLNLEDTLAPAGVDSAALSVWVSLADGPMPQPFAPLNYRWEITDATGNISEIRGEILYQPDGEWTESGDTPLRFVIQGDLGTGILRQDLLTTYDLLSTHLQSEAAPTFRFILYEPQTELCRIPLHEVETICTPDDLREFYAQAGLTFIQRSEIGFEAVSNQLTAALVEAFYTPVWPDSEVPAWFVSGLTQLYRQAGHYPAWVAAQSANQTGGLLSLAILSEGLPDDADSPQRALWESQSYLMLLYLADQYGAATPFDLALALGENPDFEAALAQVSDGLTLDGLYRRWVAWLPSKPAEVASLWNPYLLTTPTPTPTATITPIPPTRTPSATPTDTLTPTVQALQERPTAILPTTASGPATLEISPTPSLTALPAGSLVQPTPIPANTDSGDNNLPCGASAMILPVVGIVLAARRKKP